MAYFADSYATEMVMLTPAKLGFILVRSLLIGLLLQIAPAPVPAAFWQQLDAVLNVPESVKLIMAPFGGSVVVVFFLIGQEIYENVMRQRAGLASQASMPAKYWVLMFIFSWITGGFGGFLLTGIITVDPVKMAFWSSVAAHIGIATFLQKQTNALNKAKREGVDTKEDTPENKSE